MVTKIPSVANEARHYSGREAKAPSSIDSLRPVTCMDSRIEEVEERLKIFSSQLQSKCAILEKIVYKIKNQHHKMVEQMLKAAIEISSLLSHSFFMGFSLTVFALLACLRVLVQQILLDVVSVFNMVSSFSQKKQCMKLTQAGNAVFREYYPTNEEFVTPECVWETDTFVLLERIKKMKMKNQDGDPR